MAAWNISARVNTSAGEIAYGQTGKGPDLVLVHGWPWSSYSWHRIIPVLSSDYRVHWYDMPGYGRSDQNQTRTGLDVQGQVFVEMLEHWDLTEPSVLAHDLGGATSLRAHLLRGVEFKQLILMNVVAMRPWGSPFFDHVKAHIPAFEGLPPAIHAAIVRAYIDGAQVNPLPLEDVKALVEPWLSPDGSRSFYQQFAQADEAFTAEIEPMFGSIRCPTQVLWGTDDPWIPLARGNALAEAIGQGALAHMSGLGHLPQLEAPAKVLAMLDALGL